ncbi:MAG: efflux RND transporter periplasmic adaptor subunit [Vicinamibacterales bacterium]
MNLRLLEMLRSHHAENSRLSAMDRRVDEPWFTRERLMVAAIGLVFVIGGVSAYVAFGLTRTISVARERVVISAVHAETFREYIPVTGTVIPHETAYLDIVEGGQVAEVFVEEGTHVKVGQPLFRLKSADLELEVITRETQLTDQLKQLSIAQLSFEQTRLGHERELIDIQFQLDHLSQRLSRQQALFADGLVSRADVDDIEAELTRYRRLRETVADARTVTATFQRSQLDQFEAAIEGMKKNLAIVRQNYESLILKAPISGHLTALDAHLGQSKSPGQRVGQIDREDGYKAEALVDEFYLTRVAAGQLATVDIDAKERDLTVIKVYPQVTDRRFKVDLAFDDVLPDGIRRGQTLELQLEIGTTSKSLVVANGPFYDDTGGHWAFVLTRAGREAQRRPLSLGRRNPDAVEVVAGLTEGDQVVVSSYESFKAFDRIELR